MKRILPLFLVFLLGCSGPDPAMEAALDLRSRCLASPNVRFRAEIRADYITGFEEFSLDCETSPDGAVSFRVVHPEEIADIPAALRFVGAPEHAAQFEAFMEMTFLSPGLLHLLSGFLEWLQPFDEQNAAFLSLDTEGALTSRIYAHLPTEE